jgi:formylglycine-generating enzyme required for sulfatase activity
LRLYAGLKIAEAGNISDLVRDLWIVNKPLTVRICSEFEKTKELVYEVLSKDKGRAKTEKLLLLDSLEDSLHLIPSNAWEAIVNETLSILLIKCEEKDCEVIFRAEELLQRLGMHPLNPGGIIYEIFDLGNAAKRQQEFLADPQNHLLWIEVEGGEFWMGEDHYMFNESPTRLVSANSFGISKHPVINRMASGFRFLELNLVNASPSAPVVGLTWYEARYFALWIGCRLPRESEWEYAARGGAKGIRTDRDIDAPYFFGSNLEELARHVWYNDPSRDGPHTVDELNLLTQNENLNPLGIANILGNVWEWCDDIYSNYEGSDGMEIAEFHQKEMMSGEKVLRGGTFRGSKDTVRCGRRVFSHPSNRGSTVGFRLVCDKGAANV